MDTQTQAPYKRFRPARYKPQMALSWWWQKPTYLLYILRELTSVFVATYAVILLLTLRALGAGGEAWSDWLTTLQSPGMIALHLVILLFAVYHSLTWFSLAPTALVLRIKDYTVPAKALVVAHVVIWLLCSIAIAAIVLTR